jgi:hypothetical protein
MYTETGQKPEFFLSYPALLMAVKQGIIPPKQGIFDRTKTGQRLVGLRFFCILSARLSRG